LSINTVFISNFIRTSIAGFPNRAVVEAYNHPEINESRRKFFWSDPDMDALRDFLNEKIGWNRDKFNSVVTPVLERFKEKQVCY
jgi:DNA excision repair protein ERCC-5